MVQYQWNNNFTVLPSISNSSIFDNILSNNNNNNNNNNMVNGGVSQILDYDIKLMSDFIIKCSLIAFDNPLLYNLCYTDNDIANFSNNIISVLDATRLPKITLLQSLDILFKYLNNVVLSSNSQRLDISIHSIYKHTIISFILANKFNDDRTFTNKSWSQASAIPLSDINLLERNWLSVLQWRLFDDKFSSYQILSDSYDFFIKEEQINNNVSPLQNSSTIKDMGFTDRNGGFNYDYCIFGHGSSSSQQLTPTLMLLSNSNNYQYYSTVPLSSYQHSVPQNYISTSVPLPQQCYIPHPPIIPSQQQQQQYNYQVDPMYCLPNTYSSNNNNNNNNCWNQNLNPVNTIPAAISNNNNNNNTYTNNFYYPDLTNVNMINPLNNINYNIVY